VVLTRHKLKNDREGIRKIFFDDVAPLDRRDALRNVILQREIAKLSHTRKSISIDVQESPLRSLVEVGQREGRTRNVSFGSKRSHKLLDERSLTTRQRAFEHHRVACVQERRERRSHPCRLFPPLTRDTKLNQGCFQFVSKRVFFKLGASSTFISKPET